MSAKTVKIFLCYVPAFCRRENVSNQQKKKTDPLIQEGHEPLYLLETRNEKANIQTIT